MKIVVCTKHIPNPELPMQVDSETRRLVRDPAQLVLDPADEYGVEIALQLVEQHGGEVTVVTMGPPAADDALRRALAMGANEAVHITDPSLAGSDALGTARALAAAIREQQPDLVICGIESTDAYSGMVPGTLAELLELPQVTFARSATVENGTITIQRDTEIGYQSIQTSLPALMTVTASIAEPRYPSFKGLMQAKRKEIATHDPAALGVQPDAVGEQGARERVVTIEQVQIEKQGVKIEDDGSGSSVDEIIAYLKRIEAI